MQGKERNRQEMDEQFVNRAWESMSAMLDREMPVVREAPRRERKILWLVLLLFIGIGIGAGSMYWFYQIQDTDQPEPSVQEVIGPIAAEEASHPDVPVMSAQREEKDTPQAIEAAPNTPGIASHTQSSTSDFSNAAPENNIRDDGVDFRWTPVSPNASAAAGQSSEVEEKTITSIPVIDRSESPATKGNDPARDLTPLSGKQLPNELVATRNIRALPALALKTEFLPEDDPVLALASPELYKKARWNFGLQAGVIRDEIPQQFTGWGGGLKVDYLLSSRFALQSGIYYHHLVKETRGAANANDDLAVASLPEGNSFSTTDYDTESSLTGSALTLADLVNFSFPTASLQTMNYLKVPLLFSYRLNQRIRIQTGVQAGYLLPKALSSLEHSQGVGAQEPRDKYAQYNSTADRLVRQGLRKFDYGIQIGMSFHPIPRLGLDVNYNYGLRDFTDNEYFGFKDSHTNQYLQVGMSYYLFNR